MYFICGKTIQALTLSQFPLILYKILTWLDMLAVYSKFEKELVYPWALEGQKKRLDYPPKAYYNFAEGWFCPPELGDTIENVFKQHKHTWLEFPTECDWL